LDLILLDIFIPDGCGLAILEKVRQKDKDVQILAVTASTDRDLLRKSFDLGVNDFIFKPIEEIEFIARLKTALRARKEFLARLQSEELYRKLAETSPDGILVVSLMELSETLSILGPMNME
jgi:response regulator of citrate/malate metabolism